MPIGGPIGYALSIIAGVLALYFVANLIRSRGAGSATDVATKSTERTIGGLSAVLVGASTVFVVATTEFAGLLGTIGDVAAMIPGELAQVGILSIGAAGLGGMVDVSPLEFIVVSLALLTIAAAVKY